MLLEVKPSRVEGTVRAPPSKSYTHRVFTVGMLTEGRTEMREPLLAGDTEATLTACEILGAKIERAREAYFIDGTGGVLKPRRDTIDAGNSGTTLRFFTAVSALSPSPVTLTGDASLLRRPMGPLVKALRDLGVEVSCLGENDRPPVVVKGGGIRGGETELSGSVSSQFISALLISCPYAEKDVGVTVEGSLKSKPYVEMTLEVLRRSGAKIRANPNLTEFDIPGGQFLLPFKFKVPGDFSSAAFPLSAGALAGRVRVRNLDLQLPQGDKRIADLLSELGSEVRIGENWVEVEKGQLTGVDIDCSHNPDLVPVLAVLACVADGRTEIFGVEHLRYKESDRLAVLSHELSKMGARIRETDDGLIIQGVPELKGALLDPRGDHRMAMAFALAGLVARGKTLVRDIECVRISYPDFVQHLQKLGAEVTLHEPLRPQNLS